MNKPVNVIFCTTCKGRVQHLEKTLPQNLAHNPTARFVVVDYNDRDGLAHYLLSRHEADIKSGQLVVYQYREPVTFHMTHAKNLAHRLGAMEGGDVLVNLDADNYTGEGFATYISEKFQDAEEDIFLWSRMIKEGEGRLSRGISGRIAVSKDAFFLAGGYDQKYRTYSPDDKDFNMRLRRLGFKAHEIDPQYLLAVLHNDKMRFKEYPEAQLNVSCDELQVDTASLVANEGVVGCGLVFKNYTCDPIVVDPIPTRVFGIGMHKTATTSLHHALKTLGLKCAHWPSAHWAKSVWQEMNEHGRSPNLERYYAATDLPMTLLYKKLDSAYPGSKFILTVRDDRKWLDSVRKHWDSGTNEFRAAWDTDPFSHRVHQLLYGRIDFDPVTMMNRYRKHNAEVLEYFRDRPEDLLVMDMDNGAGWNDLCKFLNKPIPPEPYPMKYVHGIVVNFDI
jgi:hypothetical protein